MQYEWVIYLQKSETVIQGTINGHKPGVVYDAYSKSIIS